MKSINYKIGDLINGLEFVKNAPPLISPSRKTRKAVFRCKCGSEFTCIIRSVISGNTKSCGCLGIKSRKKRFTTHGLRKHPIYKIWSGIKTRCYNKNRADYKYYGGLGIALSGEFQNFKCFFDYVTNLQNYNKRDELKLTIDRIDVLKNYEKGNLKWSTRKEQSLNQRRST